MFYDDQYTLFNSSRSVFLRMRNVSDQVVETKPKFYVQFFFLIRAFIR